MKRLFNLQSKTFRKPEVIVREIPTYDRDHLLSDCGGAAGLLLGLNIATLLGFLGELKLPLQDNFIFRLHLRLDAKRSFRAVLSTYAVLGVFRLHWRIGPM